MIKTCLLCEATSAGTATTFTRRRAICNWCDLELIRLGLAWCATGRHKVEAADMATGKPRCKACERSRREVYEPRDRRAYAQAWRAANAEHVAAYAARPETKAKKRISARLRYWRNPDRFRAMYRMWQRRRSVIRAAQHRAYYWRQPEIERARSRQRYQQAKIAAWRRTMGKEAA